MLSFVVAAALAASLSTADIAGPAQQERSLSKAPAMVVGILDDRGTVSIKAFGRADTGTHFEIGSISKQFTAVAILQLKERGKLSLDDPLSKYLPQLHHAAAVTIRELLNQTSGIPDTFEGVNYMAINQVPPYTFEMLMSRVKDRPLDFVPGSQWEYSNTNYQILGRIVEIVSGQSWESYLRDKLFAPAAMVNSGFLDDESTLADMAVGYRVVGSNAVPAPRFHGWENAAVADGGIVSNAADVLHWDQALFGGKLISSSDLVEMTTPGTLADGSSTGYGYGIAIEHLHGETVMSHNGGMLGYSAYNAFYPKTRQAIVILENIAGASPWIAGRTILASTIPQQQSTSGTEPPAITAQVKLYWKELAAGTLDRSRLAPALSAKITPAILSSARATLTQLGPVLSWSYKGMKVYKQNETCYEYIASTRAGIDIYVQFGLDHDGLVTTLLIGSTSPTGYRE